MNLKTFDLSILITFLTFIKLPFQRLDSVVKILIEIGVPRLKNSEPDGFKGLLELLEAFLLVPVPLIYAPVADSNLF